LSNNRTPRKSDRKTLQLCGQVSDTLNLTLAGDSGDDVLGELQVISVVPAPDASQLLVVLAPTLVGGPDEKQVITALAEASVRLRAGVASAITRRRAPKLLFQFVNCPLTRD
jgi:ribosome-binding factor A